MRKVFCFFIMIFPGFMILAGTGKALAEPASPRIILYTYYRQMGWGDRVQIGSLDEKGVIRKLIGHDSSLKWPYKPEEQLEYLSQTEKFTTAETLTSGDLFAIKSLIWSTEDQGNKSVPAALDAGTEKSYAVQYSDNGEPVFILLGMSGDSYFENFDPDAQALYLLLRRLFPEVTCYAYGSLNIGPQGFIPVPFSNFTGLDASALTDAEIKGIYNDCEEGNIPLDLTAENKKELMDLIRSGTVTGKADCVESSGGIYWFQFYDQDDNQIGEVGFEDGLLVTDDGRYYFDAL